MKKKFNIEVKMAERWIPHFLAMLNVMEAYGEMGCSREVGIYSDGDGDFRPEFYWDEKVCADSTLVTIVPKKENNGNVLYDAG